MIESMENRTLRIDEELAVPSQSLLDYGRIEKALEYLDEHSSDQPSLSDVAEVVGLSEFHAQRLFTRWAGISPKRFLMAVTVEHARHALVRSKPTLDAAFETGLSGTGRLHDLLLTMEAVPPGAYARGGDGMRIRYGVAQTPFGFGFLASTDRGVCSFEFLESADSAESLDRLTTEWPRADVTRDDEHARKTIHTIFGRGTGELTIHIRGTNFQFQVWRALLAMPEGAVTTYGDLAGRIGRPQAARAVGGAVARNPVAYLIPCHRVIQRLGETGGYRWGRYRKRAILACELGAQDH